ncbi:type II secretion system F family protein [Larsenimonas rhizosphaerae]|uniref:Type II secretion system F family protein n=1 Tax=Larsenimonas rhizosphaerae TaxID=2944682 RepID=A0AA41ZED7_9GAMM|nr:type II secretion system F family protein [Larsenimonas rhizosphaerae]MCM2131029.1 type II secretion system F family protein [Larsenimonas rhizosphaerae]MCX2523734.1 type II secretion system F family protein [Larsenimonas rhizosphaerae]
MATSRQHRGAGIEQFSQWQWRGKNARGELQKGIVVANGKESARSQLVKQGIMIKQLQKKRQLVSFGQRVTGAQVAVFTRQLATMIRAGIPLLQSLTAIGDSTNHAGMRHMIHRLHSDISEGKSLAQALEAHPRTIDALFVNLVAAGEQAGALDRMLERVADYKEKIQALKSKVRKALYYPAAVISVGLGVTAMLLIKVVPQFESMFKGFGADLPAFTQLTLNLSAMAQAYWWQALLVTGAGLMTLKAMLKRSPRLVLARDRLALKLPVLGPILERSAVARFARTLATSFAAGVPLIDALETSAGAAGNRLFEQAILGMREDVVNGQSLNFAMRNTGLFGGMALQMVAIGEEAGSLDAMLNKVADFFEQDVEDRVDTLTSLLEPLIIVVLGVLVGGLVLSMYLPIFEMGNAI